MAYVQSANLCAYVCLTLLPTVHTWRPGDHRKATLGRRKAGALLCIYVVAIVSYAAHLLLRRAATLPRPRPARPRHLSGPSRPSRSRAAVADGS